MMNKKALENTLREIENKAWAEYRMSLDLYIVSYEPNWDEDEEGQHESFEIAWDITWGDWKHEHWRSDVIVSEELAALFPNFTISLDTEVTEEDGSDCYSAYHSAFCYQ